VTAPDEDELWRSIVDNYGDRPELAEEEPPPTPVVPASLFTPLVIPAEAPVDDVEDRYVPPTPPPLPRPDNRRLVAWTGLFGVPALLLVCLVFGINLAPLVSFAMVAWFVGGFTYLVVLMPRGPRDPDDDGARV